jgi:phosphoglycerol transferase
MLPGTQWTLAAMISSQCGVPQMLHGFIGKNNLSNTPQPLQHAVCMADILQAAHYQTLSIDSASPAFAGNGNFLSAHNFAHVRGATDIEAELPNSQLPGWWGVSDAALFAYTKKQIGNLASSGQPFYVSLNTMNTHGPEGVLAPSCKQKGFSKSIDSIFDCSVDEVGEFLTWLNAQPFSQNTVVVVMGDHPIMAGHLFANKLVAQAEPEIFFMIQRPDGVKLPSKNMTHVDIFPTTMAALGFDLPNDRLALGHNIYNSSSLIETVAPDELRKIIRKPSPAYDALW